MTSTTKFMTPYLLMAVMVLNVNGLQDQSLKEQQQQQQQVGTNRDSTAFDLQNRKSSISANFENYRILETFTNSLENRTNSGLLPTKVKRSSKIDSNIEQNYEHDQKEQLKRTDVEKLQNHHYHVQPPTPFNNCTILRPQSFHPGKNNSLFRCQYYAQSKRENQAANCSVVLHIKRQNHEDQEERPRRSQKNNKLIDHSQEKNYDQDIHNKGQRDGANANNGKSYHKGLHYKDDNDLSTRRETNEDRFEEKIINENTGQQRLSLMHETRSFHDIYKRVPAGPKGRALFGHVENGPQLFAKRFESQNSGNRYRGEVFWMNKLTGDYGEHRWDLVQGKL